MGYDKLQGESHSGCTHLKVEVELVTPKWHAYDGLGCYALVVSEGILQENGRHSGV